MNCILFFDPSTTQALLRPRKKLNSYNVDTFSFCTCRYNYKYVEIGAICARVAGLAYLMVMNILVYLGVFIRFVGVESERNSQ